jgi:SoxA/TsdA, cytochrome c domain
MKPLMKFVVAALLGAAIGATAVYLNITNHGVRAYGQSWPTHHLEQAGNGGVVVQLCDGVTTTKVKGLKPGQQMSHAQAVKVTRKLMAEWQRKHPGRHWVIAEAGAGEAPQPDGESGAKNIAGPGGAGAEQLKSQQGDIYASFGPRDYMVWKTAPAAFVEQGNKIFHSAKLLGSTIGVSCDMCHPNAANTHPETYPKYQVQLQRVVLLRDMIEWCIEQPVKGKELDANDPKMRALEAYILAQRKGVPLNYGKH